MTFHRFIKTGFAFLLLSGLGTGALHAQVGNSMHASYDSSLIPELFNRIPVGFVFVAGPAGATQGWLRGRIPWKDLSVTSPQGTVEKGILTFDRGKVWQNHHEVSFTVGYRGRTYRADMPLPYVQSFRFHLFTDSLKRDNPFDLNVVARFSSGKVYPLDTSMVSFTRTGGGTLAANRLTVSGSDTTTRFIHVVARLRADPALMDTVTIPVKIVPDTASLPSEEQLLKGWQGRTRRRGR